MDSRTGHNESWMKLLQIYDNGNNVDLKSLGETEYRYIYDMYNISNNDYPSTTFDELNVDEFISNARHELFHGTCGELMAFSNQLINQNWQSNSCGGKIVAYMSSH